MDNEESNWPVSDITLMTWLTHPNYVDEIYGTTALHELPSYDFDNTTDTLELLLYKGADVNAKSFTGSTPLMSFIENGSQIDLLKVLLDSGADIQCTDNNSSTVLHILPKSNELTISLLKFLVSRGADVEAKDSCCRTPLMLFVQSTCNVDAVTFLLEAGADIHCKTDEYNFGVLHIFAENKENRCLDMLKLLIDYGADVNAQDDCGKTPLMLFLAFGLPAFLVKLLLESGVDVNLVDNFGRCVLHYCAQYEKEGCEEIIKLIVERMTDVDRNSVFNKTPLMLFAEYGRPVDLIRVLLEAGAEINSRDNDLKSALHLCAESKNHNIEVVKFLIENGVDVNGADSGGFVPLFKFLKNSCNIDIIKLLVNAGADVTVRDQCARNVLHYCSYYEHESLCEITRLFVSLGVDINGRDERGSTPLCYFLRESCNLDTIHMLIQLGANVHCINQTQRTVLFECNIDEDVTLWKTVISYFVLNHGLNINHHVANGTTILLRVLNEYLDLDDSLIKFLINLGADVNAKDSYNNNALHVLAWNSLESVIDIIQLLIENNVDVDAKNNDGVTPLGAFLASSASSNIIHFLLETGADVNCLDNRSKTLLHMCTNYDADPGIELIHLLVSKGVDINARSVDGKTPLLELIDSSSNETLLEGFVSAGADLNCVDMDHQSALHLCADSHQVEMLKALLKFPLDVNIRDINSRTPLMKAVSYGSYENIKRLLEHGADANCKNECSKNALHLCSELISLHSQENEILDIVHLLVQVGIDVNAKDCRGRTPLMNFIEVGDMIETIEFLINSGADVMCSDIWGNTPLHISCDRSLLEVEDSPKTYSGMLRTVKLLALNGGDVYFHDSRMQIPVDLLVLKECFQSDLLKSLPIIDELLKHMHIKDLEIWEFYVSKLPNDETDVIELKNKIIQYSSELAIMKNSFIKGNVSLYDLCKEGNKYKLSLYIKGSKVLNANSTVMTSLFPNYFDLLNSRIGVSINRATLLSKFDGLSISETSVLNNKLVIINGYCLHLLSKYLNETEMSNFILASQN